MPKETLAARREIFRLAKEQGVKPIKSIEDLRGDFWPEDESIDEFIATIRRWRREGSSQKRLL